MVDTKAADLGAIGKEEEEEVIANSAFCQYLPSTSYTSHRPTCPTILKEVAINLASHNSPFTVATTNIYILYLILEDQKVF